MSDEEKNELVPKKQSLFPLTPDDIVDNALQNLDEKQAKQVTRKAADEVVRIAIEKRRSEFKSNAARNEMRNVVENANLLDDRGGEYKINSTFETASGTTNVEIQNSKPKRNVPTFLIPVLLLTAAVVIFLLLFFR